MNIRNVRELKAFARERLDQSPAQKRVVQIYAGITLSMALVVLLGQFLLDWQIGKTSGLGAMGTRGVLSGIRTMLPLVESAIAMCLSLGYVAAMLRVARGQYLSPNTLRLGFDRFWALLRLLIIESLIITGASIVCLYAAVAIFVVTPLSRGVMEILMPLVSQSTTLDPDILLDDSLYLQLTQAMTPVMVIFLILLCLMMIPILLRYRMAEYVLIDKPGVGAMGALKQSRRMMRRNCWNLVRLDLSLWWYYGLLLLVSAVAYGDQILPLLGVQLPISEEMGYYGFLILCQVLQAGVMIAFGNRVQTAYALAYDAIRPQEQPTNGVVLGNIFKM